MYYENDFKINSLTKSFLDEINIEDSVIFEDAPINVESIKSKSSKLSKKSDMVVSLVSSDKYNTDELIEKLSNTSGIIYAERNGEIKAENITNDQYSKYQWALENNGQNAGTKGLDINPMITSSQKEKVVAVVDSGVDYTNSDLKNVMWNNNTTLPGTHGYNCFVTLSIR